MAYIEDAEVNKAEAILEPYNAAIMRIRNDADLSPEGRMRAFARVYLKTEDEMAALRESRAEVKTKTKTDLVREIFGAAGTSGADAISARDADDRAAHLDTSREALTLLERAEANGDQVLARSIAQRAYSEGAGLFGISDWSDVLDAYTAKRPNIAAKLLELEQSQRNSAGIAMHTAFIFSVQKPTELDRYSMTNIRAAAVSQADFA